jgi:hypothetical protein
MIKTSGYIHKDYPGKEFPEKEKTEYFYTTLYDLSSTDRCSPG